MKKKLGQIVNQDLINDFVTAVEDEKGFVAHPDKIFRHLVSELGELDRAIFDMDKRIIAEQQFKIDSQSEISIRYKKSLSNLIGHELLDILFLTCYMAKVYGVDLNDLAPHRIHLIKGQYGVEWPKKKQSKVRKYKGLKCQA